MPSQARRWRLKFESAKRAGPPAAPSRPNAFLASTQQAQWYYEAIKSWSSSNAVKTILFEAYDEPWKGSQDASNSEAFFGIWQADGTSSARTQYTLSSKVQKYTISAP